MRQWRIARHFSQLQMKRPGQANRRAARDAVALAIDQRVQAFQLFWQRSLTGQSDQRHLGQAPCVQRLPGLFDIGCGDTRAMVGSQDNDLLVGQSRQHAANFTASSAEHLAQAVLGKAAAGQEALFENGVEDPG
jgi:hypothetical protein